MWPRVRHALQAAILTLSAGQFAQADNPVEWTIVEVLQRTDSTETWTSPTSIDLGKMAWQWEYEITKLTGTVNVPFLGDVTQDITSDIPADARMASGETRNLPAVLFDDVIVESDSGSSVDVFVEVDELGFGRAVFSNITLGTIDVPLFGEQPIERINLEGNVRIVGYAFGDYNRDGSVDAADYVVWRGLEGESGPSLAADGNNDGQVNQTDYEFWQVNFGPASAAAALTGASVPEPRSMVLFLAAGLAAWLGIRPALKRRAPIPR